jgi:hypothetical protein
MVSDAGPGVADSMGAVLVLCFFNGHCWPVMATHDLPGRDDGGCQFCDGSVETRMADCSWIGRAGTQWSGRGGEGDRVER